MNSSWNKIRIDPFTGRRYGWSYDHLYRLTNETISALGGLGYQYDPVGNRTNRVSTVSGLGNQTPTYNTNDWLASDDYDADGNTTNSDGNYYQYDDLNHLVNVNNGEITYTYDGDGNRVGKTVGGVTTFYLVDDRNPSGYAQVVEEWTYDSSDGNRTLQVYNYGLGLMSQQQVSLYDYYLGETTNVVYYGLDGHGSVRFLTDTNGTITDTYTYDAYGNLINSTGSTDNDMLYCGEYRDPDVGMIYLRNRWDITGTGRFLTSDDDGYGNNEDPLSLHKYLYGQDNPVDGSDPSGHDDLDSMLMPVFSAIMNFSITPQGSVSFENTCGPDVTKAVQNTLENVELAYDHASYAKKEQAASIFTRYWHGGSDYGAHFWDIEKLAGLGEGDNEDFGNGSHLGTGVGQSTVQFGGAGNSGVYYGGQVNYVLFGKMFSLFHKTWPHEPEYSELSALEIVNLWKKNFKYNQWSIFGNKYAQEALGFTRLGFEGDAYGGAPGADLPLRPNPSNAGSEFPVLYQFESVN